MRFYPNCQKCLVFKQFDEGQHPSELVKMFTLTYRSLMVYYERWKPIAKPKITILGEFEKAIKLQIENWSDANTLERFIRERVIPARKYLRAQSYEWFHEKNIDEVLKIVNRQPWRWEKA